MVQAIFLFAEHAAIAVAKDEENWNKQDSMLHKLNHRRRTNLAFEDAHCWTLSNVTKKIVAAHGCESKDICQTASQSTVHIKSRVWHFSNLPPQMIYIPLASLSSEYMQANLHFFLYCHMCAWSTLCRVQCSITTCMYHLFTSNQLSSEMLLDKYQHIQYTFK